MEEPSIKVSFDLEYEILVACSPLLPRDACERGTGVPIIGSYDWMGHKRQCLLDLKSELERLIAEELERDDKSTNLEELRRYHRNIKFISSDRMENINATQLAIAQCLQNKNLPASYTIGNLLDDQDGQSLDLYHFLSRPEHIYTSIPEWANCFCVQTDSTILPKSLEKYKNTQVEWASIEVSTPVFRSDASHVGSSEIQKLCATLRDEFLS